MFIKPTEFLKFLLIMGLAALIYILAPDSLPEAGRRMAVVFIVAAVCWALEIIPLYATSLLVVVIQTFWLAKPGGVLNLRSNEYDLFFQQFGNPIIILFFGGFVLASALHKYGIDKIIAVRLLKVFGLRPYAVLCGFMVTTAFLSMWMSDTATTAMMIAMVIPLLDQMESDDPFRTGLILSIPFAALIGGMGTPVGTPPNAIAIGTLAEQGIHISFWTWMKMAVPLGLLLLTAASLVLFLLFPPRKSKLSVHFSHSVPVDTKAKWAMGIAAITITLWLTSGLHHIPSALSALVATGLFAVFGMLEKEDFRSISWDILILMWGGLALGKGMEISGLTQWVIAQPLFHHEGALLIVVFCIVAVLLSTFMSNTAAANLLIPIAVAIPGQNPVMLSAIIALSCSLAMSLPVSTPPNAIAFSTNKLKSTDMLRAGIIISALSTALILAGFQLVIPKAFGF